MTVRIQYRDTGLMPAGRLPVFDFMKAVSFRILIQRISVSWLYIFQRYDY